ncbi:hypothetical protein [Neisseria zoodegmatis]|uniref:hypothetical protein n=1 Tax=Neisseria zoodegmatis TaxID=326523 RepID=UPI000AAF7A59|nr:hypothetical protein [Neisseria zoodegmatis]
MNLKTPPQLVAQSATLTGMNQGRWLPLLPPWHYNPPHSIHLQQRKEHIMMIYHTICSITLCSTGV